MSAAELPPPPAADPVHRAACGWRDETAAREAVLRAWRAAGFVPEGAVDAAVTTCHYKPWARARLIVRVEMQRTPPRRPKVQFLYVQAYPSQAAARRRLEHVSKSPLRCVGPPVFLVPEWSSVAWALPNGPLLRSAKIMLRRPAFRRFLIEAGLLDSSVSKGPRPPELIRYVPRRRAVFRTTKPLPGTGRSAYFKIYSPAHDLSAVANLSTAAAAAAGSHGAFSVPELLAHVPRRRAVVMAELPGVRLGAVDALRSADAHHATGRALAALHSSRLTTAATWLVEGELSELRAGMADVATALPALASDLRALVSELDAAAAALAFPSDRLIHGNMFGEQVLVASDLSIGIVDWDDLRRGDPMFDLGRLIADVLFVREPAGEHDAACAALVSGYESAGGVVEASRLRWHVATALLLRAKISALRTLKDGWIAAVVRAVARAREILSGEPAVQALILGSRS